MRREGRLFTEGYRKMKSKAVCGIMLTLLFIGMLTSTFNIQPVKSDWTWTETIYIRADGSVHPDTAPISSVDNVTYTLTDNIVGDVPSGSNAIVVERDNIVVDGVGYTIQGPDDWSSKGIDFKGIDLSERSNVTIKNMEIKAFGWSVWLSYSSNNNIYGNNITNNAYGILLAFSSDNTISGNNIIANEVEGIWLLSSSNNSINGNNITNDGNGIWLLSSSNNNIYGNNITNSAYGISLHQSSNDNNICGNYIENMHGIELSSSLNNNIYGNNIKASYWYGIRIAESSNDNDIYGNNITNNIRDGIQLMYSSNNSIHHNNFIDNTNHVYIHTSGYHNFWDDSFPSGGNYWSDHVCTGNPSDGTQPYIIDADNIDHYPFQDPNGWLLHQLTVTSSPITGITFTIDGTPKTTPYTEWLLSGSYTLIMPETHNGYVWSHWLEDGDTNRIKTILLQGTTWTAVYEPAPKPVGGKATPINMPINSLELLTPYIGLTLLLAVAVVTVGYVKKRRRHTEINS